uniref:RAD54 homolog B n=1 Tax=Labrus bergylta TaxID=56723 RepID=A0A3Q3EDH0_9LABR
MGIISNEDFAKGRCFQEVQVEKDEPHTQSRPPPPHRISTKPFCPPTLLGRGDRPGSKPEEEQTCRPRHDPWHQVCRFKPETLLITNGNFMVRKVSINSCACICVLRCSLCEGILIFSPETVPTDEIVVTNSHKKNVSLFCVFSHVSLQTLRTYTSIFIVGGSGSFAGSLVMPRPSPNHQWSNNKAGLPVVDVVIDPHLTHHLRPHQRDGLLFLYECVTAVGRYGAILADEMGLGKTLQTKRVLVVTPGSLVQNWGAEFNKWLGRERISVFTVDQVSGEICIGGAVSGTINVCICSTISLCFQVQKVEFGLIICDEGHRLKNSTIKTSSALCSLSCTRRVILTGTPVQNDLQEFYAIIEFVNPGILGSSTAYRKVYEEPILRSRQPSLRVLGEERAAELSRLTGMFILRRTQEIINRYLPPRLDWTLFCEPSPLQLELYEQLLCHRVFRACLQGSTQTHTHLACITALKKLCNHPGLLHSTVKVETDGGSLESSLYDGLIELFPESYSSGGLNTADSGKLLVLSDLLTAIRQLSPSDRVVVVSNYTKTLDLLQDLCAHMGYTFCRLDGQTPTNQRQRLVDNFNSPYSNHFLFLLSSKAGGVGLNLVGASHLVLYDIDWNPANDIQAMARVWRDGQKKTVHIYRLLTAGTIEERIFQRQVSKQGLSGTVVDLGKGAEHTSFSSNELRDLFSLTDTPSLTHDLLNCSCSMDGSQQVDSCQAASVHHCLSWFLDCVLYSWTLNVVL